MFVKPQYEVFQTYRIYNTNRISSKRSRHPLASVLLRQSEVP